MKRPKVRFSLIFILLAGITTVFAVLGIVGREKNAMDESSISQQAQEYLISRYTANFSILSADQVKNTVSPLPGIKSSYHWELIVESDKFPGNTFTVYSRKNGDRWEFTDNYCNLVLQDEANAYFYALLQPLIEEDYMVDIFWGKEVWPKGISEGNSMEEWLEAGGNIWGLYIYLRDVAPVDVSCKPVALEIFSKTPSVRLVKFYGLTNDGFECANEGVSVRDIWNNAPKNRLGSIQYLKEGNP